MDLHTDLDKYTSQWEKALKNGVFDDAPAPPQPSRDLDFFGNIGGEEYVPLNECDAKYWERVYRLSKSSGSGFVPDPLNEVKERDVKPTVKKITDRIANASNPIYPQYVGMDQDMKPTRNWSDGPELRELAELKKKLEQLESKMNAREGLGKNSDSIQTKIDKMREDLDELSDSLTNNRFGRNGEFEEK